MLKISNLSAQVEGAKILKNINLTINSGEFHIIMGPNGSGKSTLGKAVAGHPSYEVSGDLHFEVNGAYQNINELEPDERAREGIFLGMQYPIEVPGVNNYEFMKESFKAVCEHQGSPMLDDEQFRKLVESNLDYLSASPEFLERSINTGFSGGEKKKNEIAQLLTLNPRLAILDETDSGLDVDALKLVAKGINKFHQSYNSVILITHYQRFLDFLELTHVHVMVDGTIAHSGGAEILKTIDEKGFESFV